MKLKKRKGGLFLVFLAVFFMIRPLCMYLMILGSFFLFNDSSCNPEIEISALHLENEVLRAELVQLKELMNLNHKEKGCIYAHVIHSGGGYIVIESDQKLSKHQSVSSSSGFLGKIVNVTDYMAAVETLRSLDLSYDLSVVLVKENIRLEAMITSYEHGFAKAVLLEEDIMPSQGMLVLISDLSYAPSGLAVGTVEKVIEEFSGPAVLIKLSSYAVTNDVVCVFEQ